MRLSNQVVQLHTPKSGKVRPFQGERDAHLEIDAVCEEIKGLTLVVVVSHLATGSLVAALNVKALVCFATVENCLVTPNFFGDVVKGINDTKTEFLALLIFIDSNVFNVADRTERMDAG